MKRTSNDNNNNNNNDFNLILLLYERELRVAVVGEQLQVLSERCFLTASGPNEAFHWLMAQITCPIRALIYESLCPMNLGIPLLIGLQS